MIGQKREMCVRPQISVCMAAYCGERFIARQIKSILGQLIDGDQLIVVDDCSTDETCAIIEGFKDARIILYRHTRNQGVLRTFEDAVVNASGEILFFSDQDDIWMPNKVATVLQAFDKNPQAEVVVSDAAIIGGSDACIGPSYYLMRGGFRPGFLSNIVRCRYLGCTMAFRSTIRKRVVPFPKSSFLLHDLWIGTAQSVAGGKTVYIDQPLVLYRRHEANATGNERLGIGRQIRIRLALVISLALFWWRLFSGK